MRIERCEVLVIGSGPGGAMTACTLAEAGRDVLLVEEGPDLSVDSAPNYSLGEMDQKYRNGGLTTTFGKTNVTYIEGRCVGGASEINAALYHRPLPETLEDWRRDWDIDGFGQAALEPHFDAIEGELRVSNRADGLSPTSQTLIRGADALGWEHGEIQRFWKYEADGGRGQRQSMSQTLIPRARAAGARLLADTRVHRLVLKGGRAVQAHARTGKDKVAIVFEQVVVCCGAVQTPLLLRRSGIRKNIGDNLRIHPMVRIAARFDRPVNDPAFGVPVQQVSEFKPTLTLGCSHSSLPHIALWLGSAVPNKREVLEDWRNVAVFYAAVCGEGRGSIRTLPVLGEPLVRYELSDRDMDMLRTGVQRMGEMVFAAGALEVFSPIEGERPVHHPKDVMRLAELDHGKSINVTTIHLFSSCPMGEDPRRCAVDSYGRLHGYDNIRVHDASVLPTSPGVNPQGTILAIVRRNSQHMLES